MIQLCLSDRVILTALTSARLGISFSGTYIRDIIHVTWYLLAEATFLEPMRVYICLLSPLSSAEAGRTVLSHLKSLASQLLPPAVG